MVDTEHFYTTQEEAGKMYSGRKKWLMEHFYRQMRVKHRVLVDAANNPLGGQWNYDHENRQTWTGLPSQPEDSRPRHDHSALWKSIQASGVRSFGVAQAENFRWPLNRQEALMQLDAFVNQALPYFGKFQDALSSKAWRLFHSLLSFSLNTKMLNPREVVQRVEAAFHQGKAPLSAVEGYVRQIIGWREYVRGVYWHHMPDYAKENVFDHQNDLPSWYWSGKTKMRCMAYAISQSLEHAHAHHIQRLT